MPPLEALESHAKVKTHKFKIVPSTRCTLGVAGLARGATDQDEKGFIQDFHMMSDGLVLFVATTNPSPADSCVSLAKMV